MALSELGRQRDVDVVRTLYQEDEWLAGLAKGDEGAIWQKKWFPHNYEATAFEAYMDMCVRHSPHPCHAWPRAHGMVLKLAMNAIMTSFHRRAAACCLLPACCLLLMTLVLPAACCLPAGVCRFWRYLLMVLLPATC